LSATAFQNGNKGDKGDPDEPANVLCAAPLSSSNHPTMFSFELVDIDFSGYVHYTTISTFTQSVGNSTSLIIFRKIIKNSFTEFTVLVSTTLLSTFNVLGASPFKIVDIMVI
jgi:hypothetical protein